MWMTIIITRLILQAEKGMKNLYISYKDSLGESPPVMNNSETALTDAKQAEMNFLPATQQ